MTNDIKVSVILTVYNLESYLRQCLDCICNQTLKDIEIICVDDSSTDDSYAILEEYAKKDNRIKIVRQEQVGGAGKARNKGLSLAIGEYLSILDGDDYFEPDMLEKAYENAKENEADIVVFRSDLFDQKDKAFKKNDWSIIPDKLPGTVFCADDIPDRIFNIGAGWAWDKLFKRSFVESNDVSFQDLRTTNDMFFVLYLYARAKRISFLDSVLAHQRINNKESLSSTREESWDNVFFALKELKDRLESDGVYETYRQSFVNWALNLLLWHIRTLKKEQSDKLKDKCKQEYFDTLDISGNGRDYFYDKKECEAMEEIMDGPAKVSVIVPVYNGSAYLHQCLDSICSQTLRNIEIICVNDGSTDNSLDILSGYAERDHRLYVIEKEHSNAGDARNAGMEVAVGEYLSFLDADDFFEPDMLETVYNHAKEEDSDVCMFRSNRFDHNTGEYKDTPWTIREREMPSHRPFSAMDAKEKIFNMSSCTAWDKLFKRDFIFGNFIIFQSNYTCNDMLFTFTALAMAERISTVDDVLAHMRVGHPKAIAKEIRYCLTCFYNALEALKESLTEREVYNVFRKSFINWAVDFCLFNLHAFKDVFAKFIRQKLKNSYFAMLDVCTTSEEDFYDHEQYMEMKEIMTEEEDPDDVYEIIRIFTPDNSEDHKEAFWTRDSGRPTVSDLTDYCMNYDVISFDIFDTLLLRNVRDPRDVFSILGMEMGFSDFRNVRNQAERRAREIQTRKIGTREILLSDIYDLLSKDYGIDPKWMDREIELEYMLSVQNPYMKQIYDNVTNSGKKVIFTTDMYLPRNVIEKLLSNAGYNTDNNLFISNELGLRKGDGTLQKYIKELFSGSRILHIGDNEHGDVNMSLESGIGAFLYKNVSRLKSEYNCGEGNLAYSVYASVINNKYNNGKVVSENKLYMHGYRVGGILAAGYCDFICDISKKNNIDKIIFLSRDCKVINDIFDKHFNDFSHEYFLISRYAVLTITSERFYYDYIGRSVLRHAEKYKNSKTLETVLEESGFGYLCDYLENADIEKYLFPCNLRSGKLEQFLYDCKDVVMKYNASKIEAAKKYFKEVIGEAKNVLVVDIGWTGTCIEAFKYFCETYLSDMNVNVHGCLLATSRNAAVTNAVSAKYIASFLYSPLENFDIVLRFMRGGLTDVQADQRHMPLEYLFTSAAPSLIGYDLNDEGDVKFIYTDFSPDNADEIELIQEGMLDFCDDFYGITKGIDCHFLISPYLAGGPLSEAICNDEYCYSVYKNFRYDATSAVYEDVAEIKLFGDLYDEKIKESVEKEETDKGEGKENNYLRKVLLVTPELIHTGAPNSLKRIAEILLSQDYYVEVWSDRSGPFMTEFKKMGIEVKIVEQANINRKTVKDDLKKFDIAICNTIVTDAYVRVFEAIIPVVWYIREATNIPDFIRGNKERLETLRNSSGITCVSEYAKKAIKKYTNMPVNVVHNAVYDRSKWANEHVFAKDEVIRFIQLGTIESRKGYDIFIEAWLSLPEEYKKRSEIYFAGGFISSATSFCRQLFSKIEKEDRIHYLGLLKTEKEKIKSLSDMDVVVVASRDESCSLVALEGAMLSKPLIVTENVGAKYMVDEDNGFIVETDNINALCDAYKKMIDMSGELKKMGASSRQKYEKMAGIPVHSRDITKLIETTINNYDHIQHEHFHHDKYASDITGKEVIVSLTSYPARIDKVHICIKSLMEQKLKANKIVLTLSEKEFEGKEKDLPDTLMELCDHGLEILWCEDDLKPHKKYYYIMQKEPEAIIITTDDDVIYDPSLINNLIFTYIKHPDCVIAARTNLMLFKPDGTFRSYDNWVYDYKAKRDVPMYDLLPTGVGGILYPPHVVPEFAFNKKAIVDNCLFADDLWLKFLTVITGHPTVLVGENTKYREIGGTQENALWKQNTNMGGNDNAIKRIFDHIDKNHFSKEELLNLFVSYKELPREE